MNRITLFVCLVAVCGSVFWAAVPPVTAGRNLPGDESRQARHLLTGILDKLISSGGGDGTPRVVTPSTVVVPISVQPTTASADATAAANAAATAVPTAALGAAAPVAPSNPDAVALAAAQALGAKPGGSAGGINIVSSAPMALSNPIDILGGTFTGQKSIGFGLGH